jgi:hypothetical protein
MVSVNSVCTIVSATTNQQLLNIPTVGDKVLAMQDRSPKCGFRNGFIRLRVISREMLAATPHAYSVPSPMLSPRQSSPAFDTETQTGSSLLPAVDAATRVSKVGFLTPSLRPSITSSSSVAGASGGTLADRELIVIPNSGFGELTALATQTEPAKRSVVPPGRVDVAMQTQLSPWDALALDMAMDDTCMPVGTKSSADDSISSGGDASGAVQTGSNVGKHTMFHVHEEMVRMLAPSALLVAYRAALHVVQDSPVYNALYQSIKSELDIMTTEAAASKASLEEIVADLVEQGEEQLHSVSLAAMSFHVDPHDPLYDALVCVSDIWREKLALDRSYATTLYNDRVEVLARAEADREQLLQSVTEQVVRAWRELQRSRQVHHCDDTMMRVCVCACVCMCVCVLRYEDVMRPSVYTHCLAFTDACV